MRKTCGECGGEFEAKRAAAKYCGERCKKRAQRRPKAAEEPAVVALPPEATAGVAAGPLAVATAAELEAGGRLETALGQAALALACRIDTGGAETGSGLAAMVREHRATLAEALRDAEGKADPLDELQARRERKLAGS